MIVHFIGRAGSGKSTLIEKVAAEGGYSTSPKGLERLLSSSYLMLPLAFLVTWPSARRLAAHNLKAQRLTSWGWVGVAAMQTARQWTCRKDHILLIDHALSNNLRKFTDKSASRLIAGLPLPDMVIHVTAPSALEKARVYLRDKSGHLPSRYLNGDDAIEKGKALARQWLHLWGVDEARHCLSAWNRWSCRPILSVATLDTMLEQAQRSPLNDEDQLAIKCEPLPQSMRWLHDAYLEQGVHWLNVINDGKESLDALAFSIIEEIELFNERFSHDH